MSILKVLVLKSLKDRMRLILVLSCNTIEIVWRQIGLLDEILRDTEIDKFNSCLDVYVLELAPPFICSSCHNTQAQLASEGRLCRPLPRQISLDLVSYSHRAREEDKDLAGGDGAVQLVGEGNRDAPHRLHSRQSSPTLALPRRRRRGQPRW